MADVGGGKPVNLPDLLHGVVAFIVHEVCPAELVQMGFGVIGAPVFSFGRYLVAVGVCPECGGFHAEQFFRFFNQEPISDIACINSHTEKLVNVFLAVIVFPCDAADGNAVALGCGIEPRLPDLEERHHFLARIEVQHFIGFLFPFFFFWQAGKMKRTFSEWKYCRAGHGGRDCPPASARCLSCG